jgi:hypothetical protein
MDSNVAVSEQNVRLVTAYYQMNGKGRDILDMVIQKLAEVQWRVEGQQATGTSDYFK